MAKQKHVAPLEEEEEDEVASSNEDEDTDEGEDERDKHVLLPRKPQPIMFSKPSSSSSEVESDSEPEPEPEPESLLENAKASSKLKSQPSSAVSEAKSGSKAQPRTVSTTRTNQSVGRRHRTITPPAPMKRIRINHVTSPNPSFRRLSVRKMRLVSRRLGRVLQRRH
ncbi:uncharacterized protein DS421_20g680470 [Arachis hypogaea]|nr:uncharacterized protein DS421_20g680470 [Arachis hypogaea]